MSIVKRFDHGSGLWIYLILSSISAYIIPVFHFPEHFLARDWGLFNSLSHFIQSSYLHYYSFPLHSPYIAGGMDIMANPQSRLLSPLSIFDLLFSAPLANLYSLIFLSILGSFGLYRLLKLLNISSQSALLTVFLYAHASWFALHYSEGHIIFGAFQLMPWVLFLLIRIEQPLYKIYLAALLAFMPLDGAMYAFIYSVLIIFITALFGIEGMNLRRVATSLLHRWKESFVALIVFITIASGKIVPLLSLHGDREPIREIIVLDAKSLLAAFFYPFQFILLEIQGASFHDFRQGFHEIGAYIGVISFLIVLITLSSSFKKRYLPYIGVMLFFFWVGSGIGKEINPWYLFQRIPVVNNAHIQTRALFVVYLMFLILFAFSFDRLFEKLRSAALIPLIILLCTEALFVSAYPYVKVYQDKDSWDESSFYLSNIENTRVDRTIPNPGNWGFHYRLFEHYNTASRDFMDPALKRGELKTIEDADYRGEIYWLKGSGKLDMTSYTPNGLNIEVQSENGGVIQVNTNYLLGWEADDPSVKITDDNGLLTLRVVSGQKNIHLQYAPPYFCSVIIMYIVGLVLLLLSISPKGRKYFSKDQALALQD
jgi:hypothetical protein